MRQIKMYTKRSKEFDEVLSKIPSKNIRYGLLAVFFVVLCTLISSFFIKYSETLEGQVYIKKSPQKDVNTIAIREEDYYKIHNNHSIIIQLNAFPYSQFGYIYGKISFKKNCIYHKGIYYIPISIEIPYAIKSKMVYSEYNGVGIVTIEKTSVVNHIISRYYQR